MRIKRVFLGTCAIVLSLHSARAEAQQGYLVPSEGQYHDAMSAVNLLLEEGFPVYLLAADLQVGGTAYTVGDYIISLPPSGNALLDDVAATVADDVMDDYGLERYPLPSSFSTQAYRLRESNVTVYFGQGTSAGALWHIEPATRVNFDVDIVTAVDVQAGDFAGGTVITFPSGGFYIGYLGTTGNTNVQNFVAAGNGFLGTCGGGVYGVQVELLDVELDTSFGWPATADLRGHIVLSNDRPDHPVMRSFGSTYEPHYWAGQNFVNMGPSVTVLGTYQSVTSDMVPYDPALSRAYGFAPNLAIIDTFWGRAGAVAGRYGAGRVVLAGTYAEFYRTSEFFHLNTLQHLGSDDVAVLDDRSLAALAGIREYQTVGTTAWNPITFTTVDKLFQLWQLTLDARAHMNGLEVENELITDSGGEFLLAFLDDQISRLPTLIGDVFALSALYWQLWWLDLTLYDRRDDIPAGMYHTAGDRIEASQSRIVAAMEQLSGVDAYNTVAVDVGAAMTGYRTDLEEILEIQATEGETLDFYDKVIDLYFAQRVTKDEIHHQSEYFLLKASFAADAAMENAQGTARLVNAILAASSQSGIVVTRPQNEIRRSRPQRSRPEFSTKGRERPTSPRKVNLRKAPSQGLRMAPAATSRR